MNLVEAATDDRIFGSLFTAKSWAAWWTCVRVIFGLQLSEADLDLFRQCTGRSVPSTEAAREAWIIAGRRAGKSMIAALVAVYLACFRDHSASLAPGERGVVMVIAADRRQAQVVLRYIRALLQQPLLAEMVERETQEAIDLINAVSVEVHTASYRTIRGRTVVAAICDEIAFWRSEDAAEPDVEIINALRPAMATIPGALLVGISSPHAKRGALYRAYSRHYGRDGDPVLVWQAPTKTMNPTVHTQVIETAKVEDLILALAEWEAEFRPDLETFVEREVVERAVVPGRTELSASGKHRYLAFCDPSGGRSDSFTLAVGHREGDVAIIDALREVRVPFSPDNVVAEFASVLRTYRIRTVAGDRYGGDWIDERFAAHQIRYQESKLSKSDLYRELLPCLNSQRVELPNHARLVSQLCALERRVVRGGRDTIDHPRGAMDDVANAVAGVVYSLLKRKPGVIEELDLDVLFGSAPRGRRYVGEDGGKKWIL